MRLEYGIWLAGERGAFTEVCADILLAIGRSGSMRGAADELGLSSCWAWHTVRAAERALGFPLLECSVGGSQGGGSRLTVEGRELLERYLAALDEAQLYSTRLYERHFKGWSGRVQIAPAAGASTAGP